MPETDYRVNIGLEVHVQLATESKLFCADSTSFGGSPNSQVSEVSLAYPGTLPVLNQRAVELALRLALAAGSDISNLMLFDRKNYFYPDLPKGYQITQDRAPIARGGHIPVTIDSELFEARLTKMHLEEDAGKSVHDMDPHHTLIDYNRAGVPLVEIVTEPVFSDPAQVGEFLHTMRKLVRYLEVSDGNMEEGSLRCDVNISLRRSASEELGSKVEIKNLNSIRFVQKAIEYEVGRQAELLDRGDRVLSETRLFDTGNLVTKGMRTKETLTDYRYFPDPDLPHYEISSEEIERTRVQMPPTPWEATRTLVEDHGLQVYDAGVITDDRSLFEFFIAVSEHCNDRKAIANWIMGPVKTWANDTGLTADEFPIAAADLADLIERTSQGILVYSAASKLVFPAWIQRADNSLDQIIEDLGLTRSNDGELSEIIDQLWEEHPNEAKALSSGKMKLLGMFMGEIMKKTGGKADPAKARELLLKKIG